jgi:hypothetical protein
VNRAKKIMKEKAVFVKDVETLKKRTGFKDV